MLLGTFPSLGTQFVAGELIIVDLYITSHFQYQSTWELLISGMHSDSALLVSSNSSFLIGCTYRCVWL